MSRQQALLDLQAIQRIPGLAGYWPADPAYIYQDSAGYIPATVGGVVGQVRDISQVATPVARRNLLTYSEQFGAGSSWVTNGTINVAENTILAPDGTLTGDKITEAAAAGYTFGIGQSFNFVTGKTYTVSAFAKMAERQNVVILLHKDLVNSATAYPFVNFNLTNGSAAPIGNSGSVVSNFSSTFMGDGWYRVSMSINCVLTKTDVITIGPSDGTGNTYFGDGTSGVYIWGAQIEVGGEATPYQKIVTGTGDVFAPGNHAYQTTTANKPYLRRTPTSNVHWLDSNTDPSAITATLGNLGTDCTVARSGPDGPYFLENVTISSTYNIAPAFGFGGEVAIFNRALTASEKALITRYMRRYDTLYGSLVNASPQMRGVTANTEMVPNFGVITNFTQAWQRCLSLTSFPLLDTSSGTNFTNAWLGCSSLTSFPLLDTSAGTNFTQAWYNCSSLTSFPLLDTSAGTNFASAWASCSSLTSFPLLDTSSGTNFTSAWYSCSSLTTFPLLDTSSGTNFYSAWHGCSSLTSFPLLDTSSGTNFTNAWLGCSSLTSFPLLDTSAGTSFANAWPGCSSLTTFPLLDTSAGTNFASAWQNCSSLTSFPLLDISSGTNFANAWLGCSSLTSFPLLDTSAGTNFTQAWYNCSSLTTFPANFFDAWSATPVADCFFYTWYNCTALTQTSLNNIVASLAVSGKAAPATGTAITLNGAPLLTTMQADSAFMSAINTLKSRNWTPTYKGTAL